MTVSKNSRLVHISAKVEPKIKTWLVRQAKQKQVSPSHLMRDILRAYIFEQTGW